MSETTRQYPVFVYGTLRPGQPNWDRLLAGRAAQVASGRLPGIDLLDCGHYPAAVEQPDAGGAVGEVVWIHAPDWDAVLADLDHLEGYHAEDPDRLYDRVVRSVDTPDGPVDCWVYVAGHGLTRSGRPVVPHGDWAEHCAGVPHYRRRWAAIADAAGRAPADPAG